MKPISQEDIDKFEDSRRTAGPVSLTMPGYATLQVRTDSEHGVVSKVFMTR